MKNEEIIEKAVKYLSEKRVTNYKLYKETGISQSAIGRYIKGDRPSLAVSKILMQYFEGNLPTFANEAKTLTDFSFTNIPFIPIPSHAGYTRGYGDIEYIDNLSTIPVIVDKNYKGKYRVFEIEGDSMDDGSRNALCHGDKILGREVKQELWSSKLHIKDWYFEIVMKNDGILTKQIINHDVENCTITCHSLNPMYDDFEINLNDVAELYNVIKIVDRNTRI